MTSASHAVRSGLAWRRATGMAGVAGLALFMLVGLLHEAIAPFGRNAPSHAGATAPDATHLFGTDLLGRDIFSECVHALAQSLTDAGLAFAVALALGTLAGLVAAHLWGALGSMLRFSLGVVAAVPVLLLAILIVVLMAPGSPALAAGLAAAPAQFLRSFDRTRALLSTRQADFARASGFTPGALLRRDLAHEFGAAIVSLAARAFAAVMVTVATMSFFGFGAAPPARDLGLLIAGARTAIDTAWWAAAFPAAVLVLIVLAAQLAAGLKDDRP